MQFWGREADCLGKADVSHTVRAIFRIGSDMYLNLLQRKMKILCNISSQDGVFLGNETMKLQHNKKWGVKSLFKCRFLCFTLKILSKHGGESIDRKFQP